MGRIVWMAFSSCDLDLRTWSEVVGVTAMRCTWFLTVKWTLARSALGKGALIESRGRSRVMSTGIGVSSLMTILVLSRVMAAVGVFLLVVGLEALEGLLEAIFAQVCWGSAGDAAGGSDAAGGDGGATCLSSVMRNAFYRPATWML